MGKGGFGRPYIVSSQDTNDLATAVELNEQLLVEVLYQTWSARLYLIEMPVL